MVEIPLVTGASVCLDAVSKSYRDLGGSETPVLHGADLVLSPGEKASLVGPSGSGKSTVVALIAGLIHPDAGTVAVDGKGLDRMTERELAHYRAHKIGVALQSNNLVPFLTAGENIDLALALGRRGRSRRSPRLRARRSELLERFGMGGRADHLPRQLSGGEAQRVALCVALANDPLVLLADESVAQLDGDTAGRVVCELLDAPLTMLLVTHDPAIARIMPRRFGLCGRGIEEL